MAIFDGHGKEEWIAEALDAKFGKIRVYDSTDHSKCLLILIVAGPWAERNAERLGELMKSYAFSSGQRAVWEKRAIGDTEPICIPEAEGDQSVHVSLVMAAEDCREAPIGFLDFLDGVKARVRSEYGTCPVSVDVYCVFTTPSAHPYAALRGALLKLSRSGAVDRIYHPSSETGAKNAERALRNIAFAVCCASVSQTTAKELEDCLSSRQKILMGLDIGGPVAEKSYPFCQISYETLDFGKIAAYKYCYDLLAAQLYGGGRSAGAPAFSAALPAVLEDTILRLLLPEQADGGFCTLRSAAAGLAGRMAEDLRRLPMLVPVVPGRMPGEREAYGPAPSSVRRYLDRTVGDALRRTAEEPGGAARLARALISRCPDMAYADGQLTEDIRDCGAFFAPRGPEAPASCGEAAAGRIIGEMLAAAANRMRERLIPYLESAEGTALREEIRARIGREMAELAAGFEKLDERIGAAAPIIVPDAEDYGSANPLIHVACPPFLSKVKRIGSEVKERIAESFIMRYDTEPVPIYSDSSFFRLDLYLFHTEFPKPYHGHMPFLKLALQHGSIRPDTLSRYTVLICRLSETIRQYANED